VDGVHPQHGGLPVGDGVDLADQPVAVEDRQGEVAPAALGRGLGRGSVDPQHLGGSAGRLDPVELRAVDEALVLVLVLGL
jgi:hypothetical protein